MAQEEVCLDCAPACDLPQASMPSVQQPIPEQPEGRGEQAQEEDVTDPKTFSPPAMIPGPNVYIEYCDRCRWAPRASWTQTELFLTFPSPIIRSITLMPTMENGGRFRVWVTGLTSAQAEKAAAEGGEGDKDGWVLVWDRKVEGGFPELKVLKQRIRNIIQPDQGLGHSDKKFSTPPTKQNSS